MDWKFCPYCAGNLEYETKTVQKCNSCGKKHYQNPKATVGIILFDNENRLVLSIRGVEPYKGKQDCIGGFVEIGETLEKGLYRELHEETGLTKDDITKPFYLSSEYQTLHFMGYDTAVSSIIFIADIINDKMVANDDISGFVRLKESNVNLDNLAWPKQVSSLVEKAFKARNSN